MTGGKGSGKRPFTPETARLVEGLNQRQLRAIPILASATTWKAGCKAAGVGTSTVRRWMDEPTFAHVLREAEAALYLEGLRRVQRAAGSAADTLRKLLGSKVEAIRLRAAEMLLSLGMKTRDALELEERLAAIERKFGAGEKITGRIAR
jgi:hypothetical protein